MQKWLDIERGKQISSRMVSILLFVLNLKACLNFEYH